MPRLSVDIDVVYVDQDMPKRNEALANIEAALGRVADVLRRRLRVRIQKTSSGSTNETNLFVNRGENRVKIEVNHVFRGAVYPTEEGTLTPAAEEMFEREVCVSMLDPDELYACKRYIDAWSPKAIPAWRLWS